MNNYYWILIRMNLLAGENQINKLIDKYRAPFICRRRASVKASPWGRAVSLASCDLTCSLVAHNGTP